MPFYTDYRGRVMPSRLPVDDLYGTPSEVGHTEVATELSILLAKVAKQIGEPLVNSAVNTNEDY